MILIVDDDPSVTASLELLLKQQGHPTAAAASPEEALRILGDEPVRLVLQDMNFSRATSGDEGLELVAEIRRRHPQLPVILITAWGSIDLAVRGMKAGAADFLTKPWSKARLLQAVSTALEVTAARATDRDHVPDRAALDRRWDFGGLLGRDSELLRILELVGRIAPTEASVLISGESGTGKELLAEAVHRNSKRHDGPFVKVNLGGISSTLFESEMFGHVRGAFTDARGDRRGRFEIADGGTIFLDEIGELDPSTQVKLLRVLQDRTFEVLGSSTTRHVDVRVIAATNRNLPEMVVRGSFREDLLYRLNLISLELPPLRERPGDVPLLADHFVAEC
ncbi:MAG: sigma-54-dependent Fis family transcriptional regulator, partial [bacterium]|nr:sigma-54-dependent Fis family transcriptional regulator [bacterium]